MMQFTTKDLKILVRSLLQCQTADQAAADSIIAMIMNEVAVRYAFVELPPPTAKQFADLV